MGVRRSIGLALIVAALTMLTLTWWGTYRGDRAEEEAQRRLAASLTTQVSSPPPPTDSPSSPSDDPTMPEMSSPVLEVPTYSPGDPVATLRVPRLSLEKVMVYGTGTAQLAVGPGMFRTASLPGTLGNLAIAGHRTTHGGPFHDVDDLEPGDPIYVEYGGRTFEYRVRDTIIVGKKETWVTADEPGKSTLSLISCYPLHSNRQRIVVRADLVSPNS